MVIGSTFLVCKVHKLPHFSSPLGSPECLVSKTTRTHQMSRYTTLPAALFMYDCFPLTLTSARLQYQRSRETIVPLDYQHPGGCLEWLLVGGKKQLIIPHIQSKSSGMRLPIGELVPAVWRNHVFFLNNLHPLLQNDSA